MSIPVLREFQILHKERIYDSFSNGKKRVLLVMPTGTGKTTVFSSITKDLTEARNKVLIIVHRIELADQIVDRLNQFGIYPGLIMSDQNQNLRMSAQVAMVQSIPSDLNWKPDYIIIDECHHSTADSYARLWTFFPEAKILGVTATPIRLDKKSFDEQYDILIDILPIQWYIDNGFLVRPKHFLCSHILDKFKVRGEDYDMAEMSKVMRNDKRIANVIESYQRYIPNKRAIVYAVDIPHSQDIVRRFNQCGIPAAHIDGKMDKALRNDINFAFRNGDIRVLVNYDIVSEGYDVPSVEASIFARRSKSRSFWIQGVGRSLRVDPNSDKKFGYVLDCSNMFLDHGFAGMNFRWSLTQDSTDEQIRKMCKFIKKGKKDEEKSYLLPTEDSGVELCQLNEDMERLIMFDTYLKEVILNEEELAEAIRRYDDYLKFQGQHITKVEKRYCEEKVIQAGAKLPVGFWNEFQEV